MRLNQHGDPVLTFTVTGWGDVYRFAYNLTHDQVEFAAAGRSIIAKLKRRLGKVRYRQLTDYWHGRGIT
jgi:hypothetical protein